MENFNAPPPMDGNSYQPREKVLVPDGLQHAVCIGVAYIGTQKESFAGSEDKKLQKVILFFEFPDYEIEVQERGVPTGIYRPLVLSEEFTYSFAEKANLSKFLIGWMPTLTKETISAVQLHKLVGRNGLANIFHKTAGNGNVSDKIRSMAKLMANMETKSPINKVILFSYTLPTEALKEAWGSLFGWVKNKFRQSDEWATYKWLDNAATTPPVPPSQSTKVAQRVELPSDAIKQQQEFIRQAAERKEAQRIAALQAQQPTFNVIVPPAQPQDQPQAGDDLPF